MGNFQGGGNRGGGFRGGNGGGGFRGGNSSGRGGDRDNTMHKAVCSDCGKDCEVPFRPSGDKPVYCNDCFSGKRDDGDRGGRRDFSDRGPRKDFNNRPAQSFAKPASTQGNDDMKKQLNEISTKLDRLTSAIEKMVAPKSESKPIPKVEVKKSSMTKPVAKKPVAVKKVVKKKK